jgi:hypothetical protein
MTYIAKHGDSDYRLHRDNGNQIGPSVSYHPTQPEMADILAEAYPGNSMLATSEARQLYTNIVTGSVIFVDLTGGQTPPWERDDIGPS